MKINIEEINKKITINDIIKIVLSLGGEIKGEDEKQIIFTSICHHIDAENHKAKLYYYKKEKFFLCYSCSSSGDIFWLVQKRKNLLGENCNFTQAIKYVCKTIGLNYNNIKETKHNDNIYDWSFLKSFANKQYNSNVKKNSTYDDSVLNHLDNIYHQSFIDDYISIETMQKYRIKFYKYGQQICIPVFDDNSNFIGIHCRNLLPELIEQGYKYIPLKTVSGTEYKFNTTNVLYGLNLNKMWIKNYKTAIITEAPKGVMQLDSFGINIGVALFGRSLQKPKRELLLKYGVERVYIALDKQYHSQYDENGNLTQEFLQYEKVVMKIVKSLQPFVKDIYVIYDIDEDNLLEYCDSPMDKGKEIWNKLFENAEKIEE